MANQGKAINILTSTARGELGHKETFAKKRKKSKINIMFLDYRVDSAFL